MFPGVSCEVELELAVVLCGDSVWFTEKHWGSKWRRAGLCSERGAQLACVWNLPGDRSAPFVGVCDSWRCALRSVSAS